MGFGVLGLSASELSNAWEYFSNLEIEPNYRALARPEDLIKYASIAKRAATVLLSEETILADIFMKENGSFVKPTFSSSAIRFCNDIISSRIDVGKTDAYKFHEPEQVCFYLLKFLKLVESNPDLQQ